MESSATSKLSSPPSSTSCEGRNERTRKSSRCCPNAFIHTETCIPDLRSSDNIDRDARFLSSLSPHRCRSQRLRRTFRSSRKTDLALTRHNTDSEPHLAQTSGDQLLSLIYLLRLCLLPSGQPG